MKKEQIMFICFAILLAAIITYALQYGVKKIVQDEIASIMNYKLREFEKELVKKYQYTDWGYKSDLEKVFTYNWEDLDNYIISVEDYLYSLKNLSTPSKIAFYY